MKVEMKGNHREDQSRNRDEVILRVFKKNSGQGATEVPFTMDDIREAIAVVAEFRPGYKEKKR